MPKLIIKRIGKDFYASALCPDCPDGYYNNLLIGPSVAAARTFMRIEKEIIEKYHGPCEVQAPASVMWEVLK